MEHKKILILSVLILSFVTFFIGFASAEHIVLNSQGTIYDSVTEEQVYVFNFSVNNTDVGGADTEIISVLVTIPSGFTFNIDTNITDSPTSVFSNASSNFINWSSGIMPLMTAPGFNFFLFNVTTHSTPGNYNFTINTINSTGGVSTNFTITVNDTRGPSRVEITYPVNGSTYYSNITSLNYTAYDVVALSRCWYSNSSGDWNSSSVAAGTNFSNVITSEGTNSFNVYCNDTAGNQNYSQTIYFTKNTTILPSINVLFPQNGSYYNYNVTLNYTSSASAIYCWYSNSSGAWNSSSVNAGTNFSGVNTIEGNNNFLIYCNNTAGTLNQTTISFVKDTILPNVKLGEDGAGSGDYAYLSENVNNLTALINITETNFYNITYNLYNATYGLYNSTTFLTRINNITWYNVPDGDYYYNVTVCDLATNCNTTVYPNLPSQRYIPVNLDTVFPYNLTFTNQVEASGTYFKRNWIYANYTFNEINPNIFSLWIFNSTQDPSVTSVSANTVLNYSSFMCVGCTSFNISVLPDGFYYYKMGLMDSGGNSNYSEIRNITLDNVAPIATLTSPENLSSYSSSSVTFNFSVNETYGISSCAVYVDDVSAGTLSSVNTSSANILTVTVTSATHTAYVRCTDNAGNTNISSNISFTATFSSGSSGGGGGGSRSVVSRWVKEIKVNNSALNLGQTLKALKKNYRLTFNVSGMGHSLGIVNVTSTSVTIEVASTPQNATLLIAQEKKFELDDDGFYDLLVILNGITSNKEVDLTVKTINEEINPAKPEIATDGNNNPPAETSEEAPTDNNQEEITNEELDEVVENSMISKVITGLVILVIAVIIILLVRKSNRKNRHYSHHTDFY